MEMVTDLFTTRRKRCFKTECSPLLSYGWALKAPIQHCVWRKRGGDATLYLLDFGIFWSLISPFTGEANNNFGRKSSNWKLEGLFPPSPVPESNALVNIDGVVETVSLQSSARAKEGIRCKTTVNPLQEGRPEFVLSQYFTLGCCFMSDKFLTYCHHTPSTCDISFQRIGGNNCHVYLSTVGTFLWAVMSTWFTSTFFPWPHYTV